MLESDMTNREQSQYHREAWSHATSTVRFQALLEMHRRLLQIIRHTDSAGVKIQSQRAANSLQGNGHRPMLSVSTLTKDNA